MADKKQEPQFYVTHFASKKPGNAVIFLVASFKTKVWQYRPVIKRLTDMGFSVYAYDYLWKPLLEAYPEEWVNFSEKITADIDEKIQFHKQQPDSRFGIIGVSVGSILAMHAAKVQPDIEKTLLVTVYGSSARQVWEHPSLLKMRAKFENSNLTERQAFDVFGHLEPTYKLDLLGKRSLLVFASVDDKVIRFSNTRLLIDEAEKQSIDITVYLIDTKRHSMAIVKAFRNTKKWHPFFANLLEPRNTTTEQTD